MGVLATRVHLLILFGGVVSPWIRRGLLLLLLLLLLLRGRGSICLLTGWRFHGRRLLWNQHLEAQQWRNGILTNMVMLRGKSFILSDTCTCSLRLWTTHAECKSGCSTFQQFGGVRTLASILFDMVPTSVTSVKAGQFSSLRGAEGCNIRGDCYPGVIGQFEQEQ